MSFADLLSYSLTVVVFLAIISVLVAAHEYGHYVFARMFGMGVEEFAIGMGKKLKVWRRKSHDVAVPADYSHDEHAKSAGLSFEGGSIERTSARVVDTPKGPVLRDTTEFTIRMLPIGGFVRIKGMVPQEDGSEVHIPGGFYSKPPWQRLVVLVAGPVASVLSGIVVLIAVFALYGARKLVDEPVIAEVNTGSIAAKSGLEAKDRITAINGTPISGLYDLVHTVNTRAGEKLTIDYLRDGRRGSVVVVPELKLLRPIDRRLEPADDPQLVGSIGIALRMEIQRLPLPEAAREAVRIPIEAIKGLLRIAKQPSTFKDEAGGAITMVAATHEATKQGPAEVIGLACLISISVGIFNLLPIPPLDGGQMLMAFAELLRGGRRLSIQIQALLTNAGVIAVLLLAGFTFFIDIERWHDNAAKPPVKPPAVQPAK